MFRGSEEKECPYSKSDTLEMLDKLIEKELKRISRIKASWSWRIGDSKYCNYYRIIGCSRSDSRTLKEQVTQLLKEGKITLDEEDTEEYD